jgi:DNA-binding response OmpR family regulator
MKKRILSVSYDHVLLATRQMLLEQEGYDVTSALGFTAAIEHCGDDGFSLFILGHSIAYKDKMQLIKTFRENCSSPIVSLERLGEEQVPSDFHASPDHPAEFLAAVNDILSGREQGSKKHSA